MKKLKLIQTIFLIIFIIMISLPLIFVNKDSNKLSITENRYLAPFPAVFNSNTGNIANNLRVDFENWFNDNLGFRDLLVKLNTNIIYKVFKTSPSDRIRIGKNGWFFYTQDYNLQIAQGLYPITNEMLLGIKKEQEFIQKSLKEKGIEYILILTPSKVSIYPEEILGGTYEVRETPIDILTKYLRENTTITVVNTKEELLKSRYKNQVFYKTDTHWNEEGQYIAYEQILKILNNNGILKETPTDISKEKGKYKGEFAAMMGDVDILPEENSNIISIKNPVSENIYREDILSVANRTQQGNNYLENGCIFFSNHKKEIKALFYGDSFLGNRKILNLFAEHFSELNFIWSDKIMNEVVDIAKPDVVIFERTERYINTLIKESDRRLLFKPLSTHNSMILHHSTPEIVEKNKPYDMDIVVKNNSKDIWSEEKQVRLCIWQDGKDLGYRIKIPEGKEVKPNEVIEFNLEGFVASNGSITRLSYQMVEEGISYFGDKETVDIKIKE